MTKNEYARRWRSLNKDRVSQANRDAEALYRSACAIWKLEQGCADCGYAEDPVGLDFDHVRGVKLHNIGSRKISLNLLVEEIEKCDVVCATCHRVRTANRKAYAEDLSKAQTHAG